MSNETTNLVQATIPSLARPVQQQDAISQRLRTFDLSIAQTLVVLAALIYERDASKVRHAFELSAKENGEQNPEKMEEEMHRQVWESERCIRTIAARWGLYFSGKNDGTINDNAYLFCIQVFPNSSHWVAHFVGFFGPKSTL